MTTTQFNRTNLAAIRLQLATSIKEVEEKFGIRIAVGNIRFDENKFKTSLEGFVTERIGGSDTGDNEVPENLLKARAGWNQAFARNPEILGKLGTKIKYMGETYTIEGWLLRSHKFPLLVRKANGGLIKLPVSYGAMLIGQVFK